MRVLLLAVALATLFSGCEDSCKLTGNQRKFGDCCGQNSECDDGVCFAFGDGSESCTLECDTDSDCPEGSKGKKCNNDGVCRP